MQEIDLCGKCAAEMEIAYKLTKMPRGVDQKVNCANCGKRRFGATYKVEPKKVEVAPDGQ